MKAIIVAGGPIGDRDFYRGLMLAHDLIIGADSGADSIRAVGLVPHIVVGDLDSISADTSAWLEAGNVVVRDFPSEKDKTDLELGLDEAVAGGADVVTLTGTWGGRFDQTLANLFLLRLAKEKGIACSIKEEAGEIHLVDKKLVLAGNPGDVVSLLALEDSRGVALDGFRYAIADGRLDVGSTLGISNVLVGNEGKIEVQLGLVLVVHLRGSG